MHPQLIRALDNMKKYNAGTMSREIYGFEPDEVYDALVVAPAWKPDKIIRDEGYKVTQLTQHSYVSGFLVEKDGLKIAWAQTASGACNLLDHALVCAELQFKKLIFAGAVGSLVPEFDVGDLCTPQCSVSGVYANHYLHECLSVYTPFETVYPDQDYVDRVMALARARNYDLRPAKVFCTDSISLEYSHLDEIKATGAELIEMETGTFYKLAALFELPAVALLVVSDNSATGKPLLGRDPSLQGRYNHTRGFVVPDLICRIAKGEE